MGKIICLMGKSAAGKDTLFKRLLEDPELDLCQIIPYTTRPIREGERNGVEYFFTDEAGFQKFRAQGKIIEDREYNTVYGLWRYFTADDGRLQDEEKSYLMIGTPEACIKLKDYFGRDRLVPLMIELDDGIRLQRALDRERIQEKPGYEEMCRRFLADSQDFSEEKIKASGIKRRFVNGSLEECLGEIKEYILKTLGEGGSRQQTWEKTAVPSGGQNNCGQ